MGKITGLEIEKMNVINQLGMKWEKAIMAMDKETFDVFKAMSRDEIKVPDSFGPSTYQGKSNVGLRCPYYKWD